MSMSVEHEPLRDIEAKIAAGERRTLAITSLIAAGIVLMAAAFLTFTYFTVSDLSRQLVTVRQDLSDSQRELAANRASLAEMNATRTKSEAELAVLRDETKKRADDLARVTAQLKEASAARQIAEAELQMQRQQAERLRVELAESNRRLEALAGQIQESANLTQHLHPIDFADAKQLYNTAPALGDLLAKILSLRDRNLPFSIANRPEIGFTSPGFAGFVLQELGRIPAGRPDEALRSLPVGTEPRLGDIVQYETGFALFYLKDHGGSPFVIGMTPRGIAALNVNFNVRRTGILRTDLYRRDR
jgi:hypothetical protein